MITIPYKSKAQYRFLHSQHPEIAKRWDKEGHTSSDLPYKVRGGDIEKRIAKLDKKKKK